MRTNDIFLCGTPSEKCTGSLAQLSNSLKGKGLRSHGSHEESFNCYKNYLLSQGYEQVGNRDFRPPGGGPIQILTKKSRFGARMRPGKEGTRHMPSHRTGGVIICK